MDSIDKTIQYYGNKYGILSPSQNSVNSTKKLWEEWKKSGETAPDVDSITKTTLEREHGFFREIVNFAETLEGRPLNIEYGPFVLGMYDLKALSAKDGNLVLIDESLFGLLFFLTNLLVFDYYDFVDKHEKNEIISFSDDIIKCYSKQLPFSVFDMESPNLLFSILNKDYETAEIAMYLFQSMQIFMMSHEISHHILGHKNQNIKSSEDAIKQQTEELEADKHGYKIFQKVQNTVDDTIKYAYCKYKFDFGPLFLFDLYNMLDRKKELYENKIIDYTTSTHPSPEERKRNLLNNYKIDAQDSLYVDLKHVLDELSKKIVV